MWGIKVHTNTSDGKKAEGGEIDTGRQDAWFPESDQRVSARGACSAGFEVEVSQVCNFTNEPLISASPPQFISRHIPDP